MPNPRFTITVSVNTTTTPATFTYTGAGAGGTTLGATHHRVFKNCDVVWTCPDGDLLIFFLGPRAPFKGPNDRANVIVGAERSTPLVANFTPVLTVKNKSRRDTIKYVVAVITPTSSSAYYHDPILEDGDDPGGGGTGSGGGRKKATSKKAGKKKR